MPKLYGYDIPSGFKGYVYELNKWMLFSNYRDYVEYVESIEEERIKPNRVELNTVKLNYTRF